MTFSVCTELSTLFLFLCLCLFILIKPCFPLPRSIPKRRLTFPAGILSCKRALQFQRASTQGKKEPGWRGTISLPHSLYEQFQINVRAASLLLSYMKKVGVLLASQKLSKLAQDEINSPQSKINGTPQCYYIARTINNALPFLIIHHSREKRLIDESALAMETDLQRIWLSVSLLNKCSLGPHSSSNARNR